MQHLKGSGTPILNVGHTVLKGLNSLLQEVALSILLIHLITLFYSIKCFSVSLPPLPLPPKMLYLKHK
jgi:hypothetical protein